MTRDLVSPRKDWTQKLEAIGFTYHTHTSGSYWDESACYHFRSKEIDLLEATGQCLHELYVEAAQTVIDRGWWDRLAIPPAAIPFIEASWNRDDLSLYGRFDVLFDGIESPKLLEYNADTPTSLIEASLAQWFWLEEKFRNCDQFNSIHERLIESWKAWSAPKIHFSALEESEEDQRTVHYLRETAFQAGHSTDLLPVEQIGWNEEEQQFVDLRGNPVTHCFKLYPWEWMWGDEFSKNLSQSKTSFIEPP